MNNPLYDLEKSVVNAARAWRKHELGKYSFEEQAEADQELANAVRALEAYEEELLSQ